MGSVGDGKAQKFNQYETTGYTRPSTLCLLRLGKDRIYVAVRPILAGVAILLLQLPQCF